MSSIAVKGMGIIISKTAKIIKNRKILGFDFVIAFSLLNHLSFLFYHQYELYDWFITSFFE
jgi:hypothetical protein